MMAAIRRSADCGAGAKNHAEAESIRRCIPPRLDRSPQSRGLRSTSSAAAAPSGGNAVLCFRMGAYVITGRKFAVF